jgi:hypothetical protein
VQAPTEKRFAHYIFLQNNTARGGKAQHYTTPIKKWVEDF